MKGEKKTVVFVGGGTGGHIYPGLAIADELRQLCEQNNFLINICWFGNSKGMDKTLVEKSKIVDQFYSIPSGKLRRYFSLRTLIDCFKIVAGFFVSFFYLLKLRPVVLFSKGGFVSVPPCFSAKLLGIPVFTHECDFTPGLATKLNSNVAAKIFVSYDETKKFLSKACVDKTIVTGNPIRPVFYHADYLRGRQFLGLSDYLLKSKKPILLVLGGSLGAHQINLLVEKNLNWLCRNFIVIHQTGIRDGSESYPHDPSYLRYPFFYTEMPDIIAAADVVLSRAGANSLWECAVLGKPLVLIPLCGAGTRGDQIDNAKFFADKGAAIVLNGTDADDDHLQKALFSLIDQSHRTEISQACAALASGVRPARYIADLVFEELQK